MKVFYLAFLLSATVLFASAQQAAKPDTAKKPVVHTVDIEPQFRGGVKAFNKFISKNLKYPAVALEIGLNGKVVVSFVVGKDGEIEEATPLTCMGAGCESEAARVISKLPAWIPGSQDGKPVRVHYSVPIDFNAGRQEVYFSDLKRSDYGYVFEIDGKHFTIDEAKALIGKSYKTTQLNEAEPFYNIDNDPKFAMADKKEVYLLHISQ